MTRKSWFFVHCIVVLGLSMFVGSCAIETPAIHHRSATRHTYRISVTDANDAPLPGVSVSATLYDHSRRVLDTVITTDAQGETRFVIPATPDLEDNYNDAFASKCEYSIYKLGYLPQYGNANISYVFGGLNDRSDRGLNENSRSVRLLKVSDLIDPALADSKDTMLEKSTERYIEELYRSNANQGILIPPNSVSAPMRDGAMTLSITLQTPNVLNRDLLDDRKLLRTMFELAGRPALELFRPHLAEFTSIKNIAFTMKAKMKSFARPADESVPFECSFRIPTALFQSVDPLGENSAFLAGSMVSLNENVIALQKGQ